MNTIKSKIIFLLLTSFIFLTFKVEASHFRYGHVTWEIIDSTDAGVEVEFKLKTAWRYSYGPFFSPELNQVFYTRTMDFGDGTSGSVNLISKSIYLDQDWLYGEGIIRHTYLSSGEFTAFFEGCCRLDNISNISSESYKVSTQLQIGQNNRPPISNLPPIVNVQSNKDSIGFFITAFDEDDDPIRYTLATQEDIESNSYLIPDSLMIDEFTGLVTWSTSNLLENELYSLIVIFEDLDDKGNRKSFTQLDFFINVVGESLPPEFIEPTPPNNFSYQTLPGDTLNFIIAAQDLDTINNTISINAVGIPIGAIDTFNPPLPAEGNPITSTEFIWIPSNFDLGSYVIVFTATDEVGVQTLTVVNIDVGFEPIFSPPTPGDNSVFCLSDGDVIDQEYFIIDLDSTDQVNLKLSLDSNLIISPIPPFTPGEGFPIKTILPNSLAFNPVLPLPFGNPISTNLTGTINGSDWGIYILDFVSTDTDNDRTLLRNYLILDQAPYFTSEVPNNIINVPISTLFEIVITADDDDIIFGDRIAFADSTKPYVTIPHWLNFNDDNNGSLTLSGIPDSTQVGLHQVIVELHDRTTHFLHQHCTWQFQEFQINVTPIEIEVQSDPPNPEINTNYRTTITITDDENNMLEDVEVNITSADDNANPYSETETTDENGQVEFCYTSETSGYDQCIVTAGNQIDTFFVNWALPDKEEICSDPNACNFQVNELCFYETCYADCDNLPKDISTFPSTLCDDGNDNTLIDYHNINCTCVGLPINLNCVITCDPESVWVGSDYCFVATVTDTITGLPLQNVTVGFNVEGANPTSGAGVTDSLGMVELCYPTFNIGIDSINIFCGNFEFNLTATCIGPGGLNGDSQFELISIESISGAVDQPNPINLQACTTISIENEFAEFVSGVDVSIVSTGPDLSITIDTIISTNFMGQIEFCGSSPEIGIESCIIRAENIDTTISITWFDPNNGTCDNGILDNDEEAIDCGGSCPKLCACNSIDWFALKAIYENTDGDNWMRNEGWEMVKTDVPPTNIDLSNLHGVRTNDDGCVTEINLYDNDLNGTLPPEIGDLGELTALYLSSVNLNGEIPVEIANLSKLEYLFFVSSNITGAIPPELGKLTNLKDLRLSYNSLTGEIPIELTTLPNLDYLNLRNNQLSGNIPAELANLNNLRWLILSNNQLSGCYPSTLSALCDQLIYNSFVEEEDIDSGNSLEATWEDFCLAGTGDCNTLRLSDLNNFYIYPNPTTGKVFVQFENINEEQKNINIYNISGEKFATKQVASGKSVALNVQDLPKGIYIVEVNNGFNSKTQKLIIQ